MHTDESINAWLIGQCLAGEKFHYDPQDRHGPALAEIALPFARLQGAKNFADLTEIQLRLTPVIIGATTILLFGAAVEMLGFIPCLVAALLFAFAPLPVYFSRYFIHETLFVAATLGLIVSGWRALKTSSIRSAVLAGFCAAFMLACKETAAIHFFALGLILALGWRLNPQKKLPPAAVWLTAAGSFLVASGLLFTWFGQNPSALTDLMRAGPHLAARAGGQGHEKPFWYYFKLLAAGWSGGLILALAISGLIESRLSGRRLFLAVYALLIFAMYSAIPYKTPWLALNLLLPLTLLGGVAIEALWFAQPRFSTRSLVLLMICVGGISVRHDVQRFVFKNPADEKNPYAYAHTSADVLDLPPRIEAVARQQHLGQPRIAVVAADAWPLPWYLRKFPRVGYWQSGQQTGAADFYVTTTDVSGALAQRLEKFRPEFFGVRPNVLLILWTPPATEPKP